MKVLQHLKRQLFGALAALIALAAWAVPAQAAFHLWYIHEAYSNPSGSVQFIELFTASSDQEFTNGLTITSGSHTFTFPSNTPAPTDNHAVLIATAGFGSLPGGATPDFTIPSNFFNPASDTLSYAGGVDTKSFTGSPFNGVSSLNYAGAFSAATATTNSPRNYAGAGTSVNLVTPEPGVALLALTGLLAAPFRRRRG
jgi:MYXO-CTERM domain-containing protein